MLKKILLSAFFFLITNLNVIAQEVSVSTLRIGPFKLEMPLVEVEEIANKKFNEAQIKQNASNYENWISIVKDGVTYKVGFEEIYNENEKAPKKYRICRVKCNNKTAKTKSGITIGMNKIEVFKILDAQNLEYHYSKYYERDENGKRTDKKSLEYITIEDTDASKVLNIRLEEGVIFEFSLEYGQDGC